MEFEAIGDLPPLGRAWDELATESHIRSNGDVRHRIPPLSGPVNPPCFGAAR